MPVNRTPDASGLEMLWDAVAAEGDVRFWLPTDDPSVANTIPKGWLEGLKADSEPGAFVRRCWQPLQDRLPRTVELLARHTDGILLLTTASRPPSLVYCFGTDRQLFAQRGFVPCTDEAIRTLGERRLPVDLAPLYRVHDGFVDFFSSDGGPLPLDAWRLVRHPDGDGGDLLEFYVNGSNSAGFEKSDPVHAWYLDPDDEEVVRIDDLWSWLDEMLAVSLEDL
jgi:hypothetical protein